MKRFFWKLFITRCYDECKDLSDFIYRCIWIIENCPNVTVKIDKYYIYIKTSSSSNTLWNENKFHGWLCNGNINGIEFKERCPSLNALYDFKMFLKKKGYNIYFKNLPLYDIIKIDDVKC